MKKLFKFIKNREIVKKGKNSLELDRKTDKKVLKV